MQITFNCQLISKQNILPFDYHYQLYSALKKAYIKKYHCWLTYKICPFIISPIQFRYRPTHKKFVGLRINESEIIIQLRTLDTKILEEFNNAINDGHIINLYGGSGLSFIVVSRTIEYITFDSNSWFRLLKPGMNVNGEIFTKPHTKEFKSCLFQNLVSKHQAIFGSEEEFSEDCFKIIPNSLITRKTLTVKTDKYYSYTFDFSLDCPDKLIEVGLNCGFGSRNTMGLGFCNVIKPIEAIEPKYIPLPGLLVR
jgi:CRISPR-associated endoribonuclease Cas6